MNLVQRLRRNRKSPAIRTLVQETILSTDDLVYPMFIHEKCQDEPIESMPGCFRWSLEGFLQEVGELKVLGIQAVALFPVIDEGKKSASATEACAIEGLVPQFVKALKARYPEVVVITDVALDPYHSEGYDGLVEVKKDGTWEVLNDETVELLCEQALVQAQAGADIVAPSDMMDGRVGAIREALDQAGYNQVSILAYSIKYASALYGPFREALNSAPKRGDKKAYQMDVCNQKEALRELFLDEQEGADIVMVKPAGWFLDVVNQVANNTLLPVAAYQVSGEYLMIKASSQLGHLKEEDLILESLMSIKRAGASMILTYFAKQVAALLRSE